MVLVQGCAIHVNRDQRIAIHGLLKWNAADKGRHLTRHLIQSMKHDSFASGLYTRPLQQVAQPRTSETRVSHRAPLPLTPRHVWILKGTTIACTLQGIR